MKVISKINKAMAKAEGAIMVFWFAIVLIVMMLLTASPKAIQIRERWISSIRKPKTKEEA